MLYKFLVLLQLGTILYTRVYLWISAAISFGAHPKEKNDTTFVCGWSVIVGISLCIIVTNGFKAIIKCFLPKIPKTKVEKERVTKIFRWFSGIDAPGFAHLYPR